MGTVGVLIFFAAIGAVICAKARVAAIHRFTMCVFIVIMACGNEQTRGNRRERFE
jgi:hypothetical protein